MEEEVGILYICTGKYRVFWEEFYETAEKHFLPGTTKHYYVWSNFPVPAASNVTYVPCPWCGWPDETLKRFHRFLAIKDDLLRHKYLYFFNANVKLIADVHGEEVLPVGAYRLVAAVHALWWRPGPTVECKNVRDLLESNPMSLAYVPDPAKHDYIMGGFNGGYSEDYMEMAKTIKVRIDIDMAQGIIAKYHDESHMNHYSMSHPFRLLSPEYLFPENFPIPCDQKIIVLNKMDYKGIKGFRTAPNLYSKGLRERAKKVKSDP